MLPLYPIQEIRNPLCSKYHFPIKCIAFLSKDNKSIIHPKLIINLTFSIQDIGNFATLQNYEKRYGSKICVYMCTDCHCLEPHIDCLNRKIYAMDSPLNPSSTIEIAFGLPLVLYVCGPRYYENKASTNIGQCLWRIC